MAGDSLKTRNSLTSKANSMTMNKERCPFKVGDTVVYRPSSWGHALDIMIDPQLQKGRSYKIVRIDNDVYIVVEGFENAPGGGIYWTEFSAQ